MNAPTPNTPASAGKSTEFASWATRELYPELCTGLSDDFVEFMLKKDIIQSAIDKAIERDRAERDAARLELQQANARERDLKDELDKRDAELARKNHEIKRLNEALNAYEDQWVDDNI